MKLKKLTLFLIQTCLLLTLSTVSTENVLTAEKRSSFMRIVLKVNDLHQMTTIKEALINSLIDYTAHPELLGNIDYEASELKTASLNISQIGKQKTAVQLTIKTKTALSEYSLFKNTLSTTIEFEVKDLLAPEIHSETEVLRRSIHAELDPYQHITVKDNYDSEITDLSYETDYDNQNPGEYTITYTAIDKAGNTSTLTVPVVVANQRFSDYGQDQTLIDEMFQLINEYRASKSIDPFEKGTANAHAAVGIRAAEARVFLSHDRPDGRHYKTTFNEYGVEYSDPYEILSFAGTTPEEALNWWKQSEAHNARLLSKTSTHIAIGYCNGLWAAIVYNN